MSNTLMERTRQLHEDAERAERLVAKDLARTMTRYKDKLQQDHRTKRLVDSIQQSAKKLIKIYDDEEGVRRAEIEKLGGQNQFSTFYERLKEIKDYHRRNPTYDVTEAPDEEAALDEQTALTFTGEEMYGRYLDLHAHYQAFVNMGIKEADVTGQTPAGPSDELKEGDEDAEMADASEAAPAAHRPLEYITYVQLFTHFHRIPRNKKCTRTYAKYVNDLLDYLISFHARTLPLRSASKLLARVEADFSAQWDAGEVLGWEDRAQPSAQDVGDLIVDVDDFASAQELLDACGADKLKAALAARNMKSGGTPMQRAERLFLSRGRTLAELPLNVFVKGRAPAEVLDSAERERRVRFAQQIALAEVKVLAVVDSLGPVIEDTKAWVEKKLAQNYDELKADIEAEDFDVGPDGSDEEDEYVYNPLKLPIGPDGKPIPYWLYKLHGLNQEYRCDICGGDVFKGRREFERHFKDSKHSSAMQALGIPPSKAFFEVTKPEEALALWQSLQSRGRRHWNPETQEEYEDEDGNVYNKKTFEDLRRQGLV